MVCWSRETSAPNLRQQYLHTIGETCRSVCTHRTCLDAVNISHKYKYFVVAWLTEIFITKNETSMLNWAGLRSRSLPQVVSLLVRTLLNSYIFHLTIQCSTDYAQLCLTSPTWLSIVSIVHIVLYIVCQHCTALYILYCTLYDSIVQHCQHGVCIVIVEGYSSKPPILLKH